MELTTDRVVLRDFCEGDVEAVNAYASDPEVVTYTDFGPNNLDASVGFLASAIEAAQMSPRVRYALAIARRRTGAVIGSVELRIVREHDRQGDMGYVLRRSDWGQGYATEAASALLRFGFAELDLHKITATCDPENVASWRVLAKIGMRQEGHLHEHRYIRGQWRDRLLFAAFEPSDGPS